jgi:malonyl-CoA/methylmalonyl-CoA synthetase
MSDDLFHALTTSIPDPAKTLIETVNGTTISYAELFALSARLANVLHGNGVVPGDRIAVQIDKSWQAVALYLATLRAGGVFLPLNTGYTAAEIAYFLGDAEPRVFVCAPEKLDGLEPVAQEAGVAAVLTLGADGLGSLADAAAGESEMFTDARRAPDDLAAVLYTSGTTGRSKGAMLTQDNLLSNAVTLKQVWRFTADDVLIHALPIFHTHGLFVAINTLMLAGGAMLWLDRFDPDTVLRLMPRATSMMGVPTFYTRLLAHPGLTREATANMRLFIAGSAPLLAETHREFEERTGHRILERYGMTEAGMITSNPYDGERRAGSVGPPLPGVEARVADAETGRVLETGEVGVLEIAGPNVFKGYWRMPGKTAEEFREDGFFITGDIARIDDDGYVSIVGRAKDLIISGGYNVYPKEVESEIDALDGVVESAVIGVTHPDFGEGVTAVVVRQPGAGLSENDVIGALKDRLARYKLPKSVIFVDALPRNTMGKVQKNMLREQYAGLYSEAAAAG